LSVVGLSLTTLLIAREHSRTKAAYRGEQQKAREASEQRALAQESFLQARRAVDFFTLVSEEDLAQKPQLRRMRKKLLEAARAYHQDFVRRRQGEADPTVRAEVASSRYRVGRILSELGAKLDALAELEQARDGMERLAQDQPDSRE